MLSLVEGFALSLFGSRWPWNEWLFFHEGWHRSAGTSRQPNDAQDIHPMGSFDPAKISLPAIKRYFSSINFQEIIWENCKKNFLAVKHKGKI
jgi:hypothetical protein